MTTKMNPRSRSPLFLLLLLLALALPEVRGGVIIISTRKQQDTGYGTEHISAPLGPGQVSPGDVQMGTVLANHGYSFRVLLDTLLQTAPQDYFTNINTNLNATLLIVSGSSAGADAPPRQPDIPAMIGEHTVLADRANAGATFMYSGGSQSTDFNETTTPATSKYLKIINTNHPITQGIPVDADGRVKIFREAYPEEDSRIPPNGRRNYEYRYAAIPASNAAPATTVLGVLDGRETYSVFAVAEAGGQLANGTANSARLVHLFTNEGGSGNARRVFLALTEMGQVLFVRAAKWAMGETLTPYTTFRITQANPAPPQGMTMAWESSSRHNYKIQASTNLITWQTVVDDLVGLNGTLSQTLNIASGPPVLFFRVAPTP